MKSARHNAKLWLIKAIKKPFDTMLEEARLTPRQLEIAELRFSKGEYNYQISMDMDISESTVRDEMARIYDKVNTVIEYNLV